MDPPTPDSSSTVPSSTVHRGVPRRASGHDQAEQTIGVIGGGRIARSSTSRAVPTPRRPQRPHTRRAEADGSHRTAMPGSYSPRSPGQGRRIAGPRTDRHPLLGVPRAQIVRIALPTVGNVDPALMSRRRMAHVVLDVSTGHSAPHQRTSLGVWAIPNGQATHLTPWPICYLWREPSPTVDPVGPRRGHQVARTPLSAPTVPIRTLERSKSRDLGGSGRRLGRTRKEARHRATTESEGRTNPRGSVGVRLRPAR